MIAMAPPLAWSTANQELLVLELARLKLRLVPEAGDPAELDAIISAQRAAMPSPPAIDLIVEAFDLSPFERALLMLCAGFEMDAQFATACATASERGGPTFALALALLDEPHWSALTPAGPLRACRLIDVEAGHALTTAPLRVEERILHFLAGVNMLDPRLRPVLTAYEPPLLMAKHQQLLAGKLAADWAQAVAPRRIIHLSGDDPPGAEDVAAAAAARLGLQLLVARAETLPASAVELDGFMTLWEREAALLPAALLVQCGDSTIPPQISTMAERMLAPLLIAARDPLRLRRPILSYQTSKPDAPEQKRLWQLVLGNNSQALNGAFDGVTSQFRLSARTIALAGLDVSERIAAGEPALRAVWSACRSSGRSRLDEIAQHIPPSANWDDLVLPQAQLGVLHQIVAQVRRRTLVYHDWGFGRRNARGLGIAALFAGASGSGKTLAAEVLASELDLDLYRIDLSSVVSKYIGETEKNLRRVFDAAEDSAAILLFDEADALFGKRSEVKDSHDRYANIEVSYLLQRMEAYRGLAILTTNQKSALDPAFHRRLRFIVNFPFPDAEQREEIWRRSFPAAAPTAALDFRKLARLQVAGGGVRNIALNAAFLAAESGEPIDMRHLLAAAHAESAKQEKPLSETETRGWI
jgi:ATPase family associated with various cellular activities (AAA)